MGSDPAGALGMAGRTMGIIQKFFLPLSEYIAVTLSNSGDDCALPDSALGTTLRSEYGRTDIDDRWVSHRLASTRFSVITL